MRFERVLGGLLNTGLPGTNCGKRLSQQDICGFESNHYSDVATSYRCGAIRLEIASLISKSEFAFTTNDPRAEPSGGCTQS